MIFFKILTGILLFKRYYNIRKLILIGIFINYYVVLWWKGMVFWKIICYNGDEMVEFV